MARNITIKDIAKKVGVSHVTVSYALRNSSVVKKETRLRIWEVAEKMGYQPNFMARSLSTSATRTLGVYVNVSDNPASSIAQPYTNSIISGVETAAKEAEYDLLLINLSGRESIEACVSKLAQRRVDGMVLLCPDMSQAWIDQLVEHTTNVVLIDPTVAVAQFHNILFDNQQAIEMAVRHLSDLGHRRIGFLGSCLNPPNKTAVLRQQAFVQAMKKLDMPLKERWIHAGHDPSHPLHFGSYFCQNEGIRGARHIWGIPRAQRPTALICYNDIVAAFAVRYLRQQNVHVPGQMSVVGIDDSDWCIFCEPNLTSIRHPLEQMGRAAVPCLVKSLQHPGKSKPQTQIFAPELIIRQSTGRPGKQPV